MDFLSKLLHRKTKTQSGGVCSQTTEQNDKEVCPSSDAEFVRKVVEDLVDNIPQKSERTPLESSSRSSVSSAECLPDLLQPEELYKKQQDPDTDATEYESAADTDPSDQLPLQGSLETLNYAEYRLEETYISPPSTPNDSKLGCEVQSSTDTVSPLVDISLLSKEFANLALSSPDELDETFGSTYSQEHKEKSDCEILETSVSDKSAISSPGTENVSVVLTPKRETILNVASSEIITFSQVDVAVDHDSHTVLGVKDSVSLPHEKTVCDTLPDTELTNVILPIVQEEIISLQEEENDKRNDVFLNSTYISAPSVAILPEKPESFSSDLKDSLDISIGLDGNNEPVYVAEAASQSISKVKCFSLNDNSEFVKDLGAVSTESSKVTNSLVSTEDCFLTTVKGVTEDFNVHGTALNVPEPPPVLTETAKDTDLPAAFLDVSKEDINRHIPVSEVLEETFISEEAAKNAEDLCPAAAEVSNVAVIPPCICTEVSKVADISPLTSTETSAAVSIEIPKVAEGSFTNTDFTEIAEASFVTSTDISKVVKASVSTEVLKVADISPLTSTVISKEAETSAAVSIEVPKVAEGSFTTYTDFTEIADASFVTSTEVSEVVKPSVSTDILKVADISPLTSTEISKGAEISTAVSIEVPKVSEGSFTTYTDFTEIADGAFVTSTEDLKVAETPPVISVEGSKVTEEFPFICTETPKLVEDDSTASSYSLKVTDNSPLLSAENSEFEQLCVSERATKLSEIIPVTEKVSGFEDYSIGFADVLKVSGNSSAVSVEAPKVKGDLCVSSDVVGNLSVTSLEESRVEDFSVVSAEASKVAEDIVHALEELDNCDMEGSDLKLTTDSTCAPEIKSSQTTVGTDLDDHTLKMQNSSQPGLSEEEVERSPIQSKKNSYRESLEKVLNSDSPSRPLNISKLNKSETGPNTTDSYPGNVDVFKDPTSFEFLSTVGNTKSVRDLRKESLYVKFDPLVGPITHTHMEMPLPLHEESFQGNSTTEDSSQRVPTVKDEVNKSPPRNQALEFVDKLISLTPAKPGRLSTASIDTSINQNQPLEKDESLIKDSSNIIQDSNRSKTWNGVPDTELETMREELQQLREVILQQEQLHMEEIKKYQQRIKYVEEREQQLIRKNAQGHQQMSLILEEYEKTISRLVAEKEHERQSFDLEKENLVKEKDTVAGHLSNIEIAFSDVHQKYERSKQVIQGFKNNEEALRASVSDFEAALKKQEQKYEILKSHALNQLESANQELIAARRSHEAENSKLNAMLKKAEIKIHSLEEALGQKTKENQELMNICDELIGKVGNSE